MKTLPYVALLGLCACGAAPADSSAEVTSLRASLADPNMAIEVDVSMNPMTGRAIATVILGTWSHAVVTTTSKCPVLGADAVATINGKALRTISLGAFSPGVCEVPQWEDDDPLDFQVPTVDVVLTDSSGSLEARFVNVAVAHTFTVVKPEASVHAGDTVTVQLSPSTDRLDDASLGIVTATFDGVGATAPQYKWMDPNAGIGICGAGCANATIQGSLATFVVPADAVGDVSLTLGEIGSSGTDKCDVAHCDMSFAVRTNDVALAVVK